MPRNDDLNIASHPPMTLMTTRTIAVQSITAISATQAIRRLSRYFRIKRSLYIAWGFPTVRTHERKQNHVPNRLRTREHHHEPIDAQTHSAGRRHAKFQSRQKILVGLLFFGFIANLMRKICRLYVGIVQLAVAGRYLLTVDR